MKNEPNLDGRAGHVDPLDDPRLTAYVLDELAPEERRSLEQELERRPELADEVHALDGLATGLRAAFEQESGLGAPRLDAARKAEILRAARGPKASAPRRWPRRLAVAASLLAITGAAGWFGVRALSGESGRDASPFVYNVSGSQAEEGRELHALGYGGDAEPALEGLRGLGYVGSDARGDSEVAVAPQAAAPTGGQTVDEIYRSTSPSAEALPGSEEYPALKNLLRPSTPEESEQLIDLAYGGNEIARSKISSAGTTGPSGALSPPLAQGNVTFSGGSPGAFTFSGSGRPDSRFQWPEDSSSLGTESYDAVSETPFRDPHREPLSTFSIDVDTASYANVRRFLSQRQLPPPAAVRIEEMVNYFSYAYPEPRGKVPFSVSVDSASSPWEPSHRLVRIGLKGRAVDFGEPKTKNLVFLVDVSGSMNDPAKLPLVQKSLRLLVNELRGEDRVALVVYAGNSGLVLPATPISERARILDAIDNLSAGGSTNGGSGIQLAYATAQEHFAKGGVNRVILATDGDFNVGVTDREELLRLIEEKAKSGVFLSVLGFGTGNLKDATMEQLADHGNGNYAYVDSLAEARKVLVREMGATLETIAKDVKIQVEFNPAKVGAWRLVGYENRVLAARDFNDDKKDAGEIGAGHTVTALYEIVPAGAVTTGVDTLRYQAPSEPVFERKEEGSGELLTVKLRYKEPSAETSEFLTVPFTDGDQGFEQAGADLRFATAVAAFGLCLRGSAQRGSATLTDVYRWAEKAIGDDPHGDRREFLKLVDVAAGLSGTAVGESRR